MKRKIILMLVSLVVLSMFYLMPRQSTEFSTTAGKPKAYVLVGNTAPSYTDVWQRAAVKAEDNYKAAGYEVIRIEAAKKSDFEQAIKDAETKAMTIIGHGEEKWWIKRNGWSVDAVDEEVTIEDIERWQKESGHKLELNELNLHTCNSKTDYERTWESFNYPKAGCVWGHCNAFMVLMWEFWFHSSYPARPTNVPIDRNAVIPIPYEGTYSIDPNRGISGLKTDVRPEPTFELFDGFTLHVDITITVNSLQEDVTFYAVELIEDPAEINATNAIQRYIDIISDLMFVDPSPITSLKLRIYYTDEEVAARGLNENNLKVYWYNETTEQYQMAKNNLIDVYRNYVEAEIPTFGVFSIRNSDGPTKDIGYRWKDRGYMKNPLFDDYVVENSLEYEVLQNHH